MLYFIPCSAVPAARAPAKDRPCCKSLLLGRHFMLIWVKEVLGVSAHWLGKPSPAPSVLCQR